MTRLQKKCLLASAVFHGCLLLLVTFGSAFFTPQEKVQPMSQLKFVPSFAVENALAGGGGNPKIPETNDRQKGDTLTPQPPPVPVETVKPPAAAPTPAPPAPPVVKPVEPRATPKPPDKPAPVKPKLVEPVKPNPTLSKVEPPVKDLLVPKVRNNEDKIKARAEAETREAAREAARESARAEAAYQAKVARALGQMATGLREGFASGTKVDLGGPGGAAFADYGQIVQAIYQDAWERSMPQEVMAQDTTALVSVTISKSGKVLDSRVLKSSGNSSIDRYVKRTLERVTSMGMPFPKSTDAEQRTFKIEFTFRNRRITG